MYIEDYEIKITSLITCSIINLVKLMYIIILQCSFPFILFFYTVYISGCTSGLIIPIIIFFNPPIYLSPLPLEILQWIRLYFSSFFTGFILFPFFLLFLLWYYYSSCGIFCISFSCWSILPFIFPLFWLVSSLFSLFYPTTFFHSFFISIDSTQSSVGDQTVSDSCHQ